MKRGLQRWQNRHIARLAIVLGLICVALAQRFGAPCPVLNFRFASYLCP
jgi:hypothetical protein